ncbi:MULTISPECIES: type II secretion system inner membrane protein GspF [Thiomicrorhabdus]|uniref:General secretion pathway protein F n=1 Tax=Thiomicrorhabdus heinhorstiae TaxID=2748010 RepID=A0ABS0C175_9GAMM|nr:MULTISPECIES: type II secretion system inner membrane protein GspF [Thiomicrorhabdus]MBF6057976.1 type II secretion system inner membrane protein GspF [Thiomicrorhabdus heinhorstiae]
MALYEYRALSAAGQQRKGMHEADSERQVRQWLREQSLSPVAIKELDGRKKESKSSAGWFAPKISTADLALFTREVFTLLEAGTPLNQALKALSQQANAKLVARFIGGLHSKVSEGYPLARAMQVSHFRLPQDYIAIIQAGEESGHLSEVLSRLADSIEQRDQLNKKMKTALIYPALMVTVALGIVFFLMVYVVPKVVSVFDNMHQALPPLTQGLLSLSGFVQNYWGAMLVALFGMFVLFKLLLKRPALRFKFHRLLMRLPGVGRFVVYGATARWARTFGVLLASGVAVRDALHISSEVMTLDPMKRGVEQMVEKVRRGNSVHASMEEAGFFPPLLLNLVKTGEGQGRLHNMLLKGAKHYEMGVENAAATLVSLLEPLLIIVMGGVVLTIVLAIMMPIFEMNQMIG